LNDFGVVKSDGPSPIESVEEPTYESLVAEEPFYETFADESVTAEEIKEELPKIIKE
jgi:hypothetical protein